LQRLPWGSNRGMDQAGTARLRYLMDEQDASMAFRVPVAHESNIAGIPVRSLTPTRGGKPSSPGTTGQDQTPTTILLGPSTISTISMATPPITSSSGVSNIQRPEDLVGQT